MLKNFLVRKLIESKMKDVPADQREMIISLVEKNPQFFEVIAKETQEEMARGTDQMTATMKVMEKHKAELQALMK